MGRYYDGDIDGKFVFGVQSSTAADRFGVKGEVPGYLEYDFVTADLETLELELKNIEDEMGEHGGYLKAYYDLYGVNDNVQISFEEYLKKGDKKPLNKEQLLEFFDYRIGKKIQDCVKKQGDCSFTAEL
jgi:hypothetical protein|tara:strand:+ start:93 stop:479 length:387 start_codon:yes stop_codon:yes gene_type:complete